MKKLLLLIVLLSLFASDLFGSWTLTHEKYRWRNDDGSESTASWKADENTPVIVRKQDNVRLRIQSFIEGGTDISSFYFDYYYSFSTEGPWTKITTGDTNHFVLSPSDHFNHLETTTRKLSENATKPFQAGKMVESTPDANFALNDEQSTEYEVCIKPTANVENRTYYFKQMLDGTSYDQIQIYEYAVMHYSDIIFVDADATGNNDGSNWTNAYTSLQSALDEAESGLKIWVAKGTYKPSKEADGTTDEPRKFTFQMINGVEIYGGFAGTEDPNTFDLSARDFVANETILSGDLNGDDVVTGAGATLSFSNYAENCYHLFYHDKSGVNSSAVLDGFTISGGNANNGSGNDDYGAGIYNDQCNPTLKNIIFKNNQSATGVLYFYDLSTGAQLSNLIFENNDGGYYGALYIEGSTGTSVLTNALIINNKGQYGGGLYNSYAPTTINNATFSGNYASSDGGGVYNTSGVLTLNNCITWNNNADVNGDEIYYSEYGSSSTNLNYSCYQNATGDVSGTLTLGDGNITTDPLFVDATNADFKIIGESPCADAGNNNYNSETYDLRGSGYPRKLNKSTGEAGTIDIGAYEYKVGDDPLPVELISFMANLNENKVELNWQTATEIDNYGFEIERSVTQTSNLCYEWETIGFVEGHGNSNSPKSYSLVDDSELFGTIQYRLKQIDTDGKFEYSEIVTVKIESQLPKEFSLSQNYPNPFNPSTIIEYAVPKNMFVKLSVYDILGREVATLVNEKQTPGKYKVKFDGSKFASGVYIYRIQSGDLISIKKLILMK